MAVVKHGSVDDTIMGVSEMLEILIVGGDDRPGTLVTELPQDALGNGTANLRFRTRTELIDENQGLVRRLPHHVLHIEQMRRIGREVILQTLLIANIYHNVFINATLASTVDRDRDTALQHIL